MMMTIPRNEISMPNICRGLARSPAMSQAQRMMKSGAAEFISTAFTVVVLRKPR